MTLNANLVKNQYLHCKKSKVIILCSTNFIINIQTILHFTKNQVIVEKTNTIVLLHWLLTGHPSLILSNLIFPYLMVS